MRTDEELKQYKLDCFERLKASSFRLADYKAPSAEWDHDHCEGCWAKFAEFDAPDILHSGYFAMVEDDEPAEEPVLIEQAREMGRNVMKKPDTKKWVCQKCFEEFRGTLG